MKELEKIKLGIIGMGYVGLPLAIEFGKVRNVIGFDINEKRIKALDKHQDETLEVSSDDFVEATGLKFSYNVKDIENCNFYVVCVPTPITDEKK